MAKITAFDVSPSEWMSLSRGEGFQALQMMSLVTVKRKGKDYLLYIPHPSRALDIMDPYRLNEHESVLREGLQVLCRASAG